ncbi:MAG: matrixin family metalloprotease [Acidobacteria bacterium]|nr:matrixin family metalloprotease [Acidobacteriota bacterium]
MSLRRAAMVIVSILAMSPVADAYYHFLRYQNRAGQLVALPQRFDLSVLPNKTVSYFITSELPQSMAPGDSMARLTSQIRLAAKQWSEVETSELRLQFGGAVPPPFVTQATPGIDVVFDEVPPGLLALGGPTSVVEPVPGSTFVPIQRSTIILPRNLNDQPSWTDAAFMTLVHEFGHTLGLQHSLVSSTMATQLTRATTRGRALAADDIAGLSLLYPTRAFQSSLGAIAGRVTQGGAGQALASVVAIAPGGAAVGTLTGPDGSYRIEGLAPGTYYVYVHPLPPAQTGETTPANIRYPQDPDRNVISPGGLFDLQFYPGVRDINTAGALPVSAGAVLDGVNFSVTARRTPLSLFNVQTYSFPGQVAIRPAVVNVNGSRNFMVATGNGLLSNNSPVAGLRASVLGGATQISAIRSYSAGYLAFDFGFSPQSGEGARHVVFSQNTDVYVQPGAVTLTSKQPPQIATVTMLDAASRAVQISGTGLGTDSQVFFDGVPALVRAFDEAAGRLVVTAPSSANAHRAGVVVVANDGQSSTFFQSEPTAIVLDGNDSASVSLGTNTLAVGAETVLELTGSGTSFVDGAVSLGFGSSDLSVKRLWVVSPTRLLAQVQVTPQATPGPVSVNVVSGLQQFPAGGLLIVAAAGRNLVVSPASVNSLSGIVSVPAGNLVPLLTSGLGGSVTATVGERPAAVTVAGPSVLLLEIPAGLPAGPAIVRIQSGGEQSLPFAIQVEPAALTIPALAADVRGGRAGDLITLPVNGLTDLTVPFSKPRVTVTLNGVEHLATASGNNVVFTLLSSVPPGNRTLTVTVDGRVSGAIPFVVRP